MTACLHKIASAIQDYLSSGCQHLTHHTFPNVNTGYFYRSFLTNPLCLLLYNLCFLVLASTSGHSLVPIPQRDEHPIFWLWYFCFKYFWDFVFTPNPNRDFYFSSLLLSLLLFFGQTGLSRTNSVSIEKKKQNKAEISSSSSDTELLKS